MFGTIKISGILDNRTLGGMLLAINIKICPKLDSCFIWPCLLLSILTGFFTPILPILNYIGIMSRFIHSDAVLRTNCSTAGVISPSGIAPVFRHRKDVIYVIPQVHVIF